MCDDFCVSYVSFSPVDTVSEIWRGSAIFVMFVKTCNDLCIHYIFEKLFEEQIFDYYKCFEVIHASTP